MTVDPVGPFGAALANRVLLIAEDGPLARLLAVGLERSGCLVARASAQDEDLFGKAVGHDTIVYLPARSFLGVSSGREGFVPANPSEVLAAGNAPGVKLLVTVLPTSPRVTTVEEAIQRSGIPYFIVRTPAVVDELKPELEDLEGEIAPTLWAPACDGIPLGDSDALLRTVCECLVDERQGRTIELPATIRDVPTALQRALGGGERRVIPVWPPIFQKGRVAARMMRGRDTADVRLIDALLAGAEHPSAPPLRAA
jgi:hypothetical protein